MRKLNRKQGGKRPGSGAKPKADRPAIVGVIVNPDLYVALVLRAKEAEVGLSVLVRAIITPGGTVPKRKFKGDIKSVRRPATDKRLMLRLPSSLKKQRAAEAEFYGRTLSELIRDCLLLALAGGS